MGKNGWYQLIPFYGLVMLFQKGQIEDTSFGLSPYIERFRAE
jgi:hypothetical protein